MPPIEEVKVNIGTYVYIDGANIIMSARNLNEGIDIIKIIQRISDVYRPEKIFYFSANFKSMQEVFLEMKTRQVDLILKEIYNENNKTKANCDVEISHRITQDIDFKKSKELILLSGDGDFAHILDFAHKESIRIKVLAFDPTSCSIVLKRRNYVKLSYLVEQVHLFRNEKPPIST